MNTLYLECYSGISGDMAAAALLDLGADQAVLEKALKSLPIHGFSIKISRVKKAGLDVCDFDVILQQENHDHDMEYLHPQTSPETIPAAQAQAGDAQEGCMKRACCHGQEHQGHALPKHNHKEHNSHEHDLHRHSHHMHRGLSDILSIIQQADMTDTAKHTASEIFTILGEAEAKAHGTSLEDVHFHEVGAVDSIVDIISTAVCLDNLNISDVIIPALHEGFGTVRCQHGILPIPVPATANIIQAYHIPLQITDTKGEFVTPTGAAIAAAIRSSGKLPKQFRILRTGLGGGKRTYERPSILRAMLIEPLSDAAYKPETNMHHSDATYKPETNMHHSDATYKPETNMHHSDAAYKPETNMHHSDVIYKLETNMDDCTGEMMGYAMECLMQAGAKDVHYFPVYMKKNRPAYQLNVLCAEADIPKLEQIIFGQTTTIGIRRQRMERTILPRKLTAIQTPYGEIQVKICESGGHRHAYPEYDSVAQICRQTCRPYPEIYHELEQTCREQCL